MAPGAGQERAHLSHFIGFSHTRLLYFLFCGTILALLLVLCWGLGTPEGLGSIGGPGSLSPPHRSSSLACFPCGSHHPWEEGAKSICCDFPPLGTRKTENWDPSLDGFWSGHWPRSPALGEGRCKEGVFRPGDAGGVEPWAWGGNKKGLECAGLGRGRV